MVDTFFKNHYQNLIHLVRYHYKSAKATYFTHIQVSGGLVMKVTSGHVLWAPQCKNYAGNAGNFIPRKSKVFGCHQLS